MPRVRDLLERFRPAGAPGKASVAGVPVDRRETVSAELEPVFAQLAAVLAQCHDVRRAGETAAARREAEATEAADTAVAQSRVTAEAERAHAAAAVRQRATAEADESLARAEREAAQVRQLGQSRRPALLARVLERTRAELRALEPARYRDNGTRDNGTRDNAGQDGGNPGRANPDHGHGPR